MNKDIYDKITLVYKALVNRWSHPNYINGYTSYEKARWEQNKEIWKFLNQFQNIPFQTYFREEHIKQFPVPQKYFGTDTVVVNDKEILFHYDFSLVLYFYCAYQLRDELINFRKMIDTELKEKFGNFVKMDEYSFQYGTGDHENIYKYILSQVPNYGLIWNLLSIGTISTIEDFYVKIRYKRIDSLLKGLEQQYDFKGIIIE